MHTKDLHNLIDVTQGLAPVVVNSDQKFPAAGVDMAKWFAVEFLVDVGAHVDTFGSSDYVDIILQHSDTTTDGDFEAVSDEAEVLGDFDTIASGIYKHMDADADCSQNYHFGYRGTKRYARVFLDFHGTHSTGTIMGVHAVRCFPRFGGTPGIFPT